MNGDNQANNSLIDSAQGNVFDIPDELLKEISGGLGSSEAILLYRKMEHAKKCGKSMQDLIDDLKTGSDSDHKPLTGKHLEEVETFISRFW